MAELKSEQKEPEEKKERPLTVGTDCSECIFFEDPSMFAFSNQRTTSGFCRLGKIAKFEEQNAYFEEHDGKFLVDRICNFRRVPEWKGDKSMEDCISLVEKEVKIRGSIVITANNMHELDQCLSKLSKIKHIEHFSILICHYSEFKIEELFNYIKNQEYFEEILAIRINEVETHTGEVHFLDEAFKRAKNGFIVHIDGSKDFDENILDKINHFVYHEMGRLLYVPPVEGYNGFVVMAVIYQFLKGNKFFEFEKKLNSIAEHQGLSSQIMTWDKINEKYTC